MRRKAASRRPAAPAATLSTQTIQETSEDDLLSASDAHTPGVARRTSLAPFSKTIDPSVTWFYNDVSLTVFGFVLAGLAALAYFFQDLRLPERITNHLGLLTAIAAFELFCIISARDGPFRRPHPALWRALLGFNLLYFVFLCFVYFHDLEFARRTIMPFFDASLGRPYVHRAFNENCDLTWANFKSQAFEIFSLAHALGWFGKALILRDWWLLNILSVGYELIEYSLAHHLPEFNECWWDHFGLDVLGCNFIGSWIGMKTAKFLEVSHFSWRGRSRPGGFRERSARAFEKLTPFDFANFDWRSIKRPRNYFSTLLLLSVFLICETDAFYIKHLLWLRSDHPLVIIRLIFMFLWSLPAVREFYEYVNQWKQVKRMGLHVWLLLATVLLELLIVIKWGRMSGEFTAPAPQIVKICWAIFLVLIVLYPIIKFGPQRKPSKRKEVLANGHAGPQGDAHEGEL